MPELRLSDGLRPAADRILRRQRLLLAACRVPGELVLVGGSSICGALTRGDVDLHLRVEPTDFADVVAVLRTRYQVVHQEIWQPTLATFAAEDEAPTEIAVTPLDSEHDRRFTRTWQRLAADPALVAEYNAVKQAASTDDDYEDAKSQFFTRVVRGC